MEKKQFNKYFVSLVCKLNDKVQIQSGDFGKFMPGNQVNSMFLNESSDIPIGVIKKNQKLSVQFYLYTT